MLLLLHESEERNAKMQTELEWCLYERLAVVEENARLHMLLQESEKNNKKRDAELQDGLTKLIGKLHLKR